MPSTADSITDRKRSLVSRRSSAWVACRRASRANSHQMTSARAIVDMVVATARSCQPLSKIEAGIRRAYPGETTPVYFGAPGFIGILSFIAGIAGIFGIMSSIMRLCIAT